MEVIITIVAIIVLVRLNILIGAWIRRKNTKL